MLPGNFAGRVDQNVFSNTIRDDTVTDNEFESMAATVTRIFVTAAVGAVIGAGFAAVFTSTISSPRVGAAIGLSLGAGVGVLLKPGVIDRLTRPIPMSSRY